MSSAKKCTLLFVALISACDIGVTLKDPDMLQPEGGAKPGIDMAETVVDVQLSNCTSNFDGVGISGIAVTSGPKVDYNIKDQCITSNFDNGNTGFSLTHYDCVIDVANLGEKYKNSNHFVLTYEDKSVTPQVSLKNGSISQGVLSSVSITGMSGVTPPLSVSSAGTNDSSFVPRQVSWTGQPDVASLRFTISLSCVKNLGMSPLIGTPVPNLSWEVKNFKLHMSL